MKRLVKVFVMALLMTSIAAFADDFKEASLHDGKVSLKWKLEGENVHFIVSAKNGGKGWIGIGFNDSKTMQDGDFVVGFVKDGKSDVGEHFGKSASRHEKKPGQGDLISSSIKIEKDMTVLEFVRPLVGKNPKTKKLIKDGENKIIISYADQPRYSKKHELSDVVYVGLNFKTGEVKKL